MVRRVNVANVRKSKLVEERAQTVLCGVVAPCGDVDNKVPQLQATQFEPLD